MPSSQGLIASSDSSAIFSAASALTVSRFTSSAVVIVIGLLAVDAYTQLVDEAE